ncbi:MAG: hypothetical protein KGH66_01135 [Candidatus Micrarchaeota archaeon]|nr:hypothetical protein [Candidatus Micrarchaeota archaeon]
MASKSLDLRSDPILCKLQENSKYTVNVGIHDIYNAVSLFSKIPKISSDNGFGCVLGRMKKLGDMVGSPSYDRDARTYRNAILKEIADEHTGLESINEFMKILAPRVEGAMANLGKDALFVKMLDKETITVLLDFANSRSPRGMQMKDLDLKQLGAVLKNFDRAADETAYKVMSAITSIEIDNVYRAFVAAEGSRCFLYRTAFFLDMLKAQGKVEKKLELIKGFIDGSDAGTAGPWQYRQPVLRAFNAQSQPSPNWRMEIMDYWGTFLLRYPQENYIPMPDSSWTGMQLLKGLVDLDRFWVKSCKSLTQTERADFGAQVERLERMLGEGESARATSPSFEFIHSARMLSKKQIEAYYNKLGEAERMSFGEAPYILMSTKQQRKYAGYDEQWMSVQLKMYNAYKDLPESIKYKAELPPPCMI